MMKTIILASKNPVKIRAAQAGFERMFPGETFQVRSVAVPSGVSDQPHTDEETLLGAYNRAKNAAAFEPQADFWVGIEGGIAEHGVQENGAQEPGPQMTAFAWIVVLSNELAGKGRTGTFFLPLPVAKLIRQGKELGEADDIVFGRSNSKQEDGAIGLLTGNIIDRAQLYEHAVILALVPFKNRELYSD